MNRNTVFSQIRTIVWSGMSHYTESTKNITRAKSSSFSLIILISTILIFMKGAHATVSYLDDMNNMSPRTVDSSIKVFNHKYPKIMLSEGVVFDGNMERYSKYDIIQTQGFKLRQVEDLQQTYPELAYFRQFNLEFLAYDSSLYCDQGHGVPFEKTSTVSGDCSIYAGHWLYEPGIKTTKFLSNTGTSLTVASTSNLKAGEYAVIYDSPAGSFKNPEHVKVLSVNTGTKAVVLERGYKSDSVSHANGSIIATHVRGQANNERNWMYNLSTVGPVDGNGNRYIDYVAEWLTDNHDRNEKGWKRKTIITGIAFDIDFRYSITNKSADVDNDLLVDYGYHPVKANVWADGIDTLYAHVRKNLPGLYVTGGISSSPGHNVNNGVQLEGWPTSSKFPSVTPDYTGIDSKLSDYMLRHREHIAPQHFHAMSKTPTLLYPNNSGASSNKPFRFAFGTALLGDGYFGQQNNKNHPDPWFDEYAVDIKPGSSTYGKAVKSYRHDESKVRANKGWLGYPLGNRIRVFDDTGYQETNDILADKGTFDNSIYGWSGANVTVKQDFGSKKDGTASLRASKQTSFSPKTYGSTINGPGVSLIKGQQYTIAFSMKADIVRQIGVKVGGDVQYFMVNNEWRRYVMAFRASSTGLNGIKFMVGRENTQVWLDSVRIFEGNVNIFRRDFDNGIVVVNATDETRIVALGGKFLRINGSQDPVNDGSSIEVVTLEPYDAAILVRPDGDSNAPVEVPVPPTSVNECGAPAFNAGNLEAIYLWKDCQGDGSWKFRITGGGSATAVKYEGDLTSSKGFTGVEGYNLERGDVINTSDPYKLKFALKTIKSGEDGVDFIIPLNSNVCFNATTHSNVLLGSEAVPASLPLDLGTLLNCTSATDLQPGDECGAPAYDAKTEQGAFLWKDCGSVNSWYLRGTAGGTSTAVKYLGNITSADPITISNYSVESSDSVNTSDTRNIIYKLNVMNSGEDGIDFTVSSSGGCFTPAERAGGSLYVGASKIPVNTSLDLINLGTCHSSK